jgi:ABC-2 type transport system ATP-binding protein
MQSLTLRDVTKIYGNTTAVDHINIEVGRGEIYALLGANGAGKTTTMRMVLGLINPDSGRIQYEGKDYSQDVTKILGYLPEERGLYPKVRVSDQILYLAQLKGMKKKDADQNLKEWLEKFSVPEYYNKKVEELSKGNQQKIQFIAAIIHKPRILVLDEAFSGLDPVNVELLKETVKQLRDDGASIVFSTHRMEHVEELCRNVCILHKSRTVLTGNLKEIKKSLPKERIILSTADEVNGLSEIEGIQKVTRHESGYELHMTKPEAAGLVLKKAMEQSTVQRFEIMEPTLNEIFIKAVGGELHE